MMGNRLKLPLKVMLGLFVSTLLAAVNLAEASPRCAKLFLGAEPHEFPADQAFTIVARDSIGLEDYDRLNKVDAAVQKLRPGEAGAAAELESYFGGTLVRISATDPAGDFVFTSGRYQGKTVDFMLTPGSAEQQNWINQYFESTLKRFKWTLTKHAGAVDMVPLDTRFLTEKNRRLLIDTVDQLPKEVRVKVIFIE